MDRYKITCSDTVAGKRNNLISLQVRYNARKLAFVRGDDGWNTEEFALTEREVTDLLRQGYEVEPVKAAPAPAPKPVVPSDDSDDNGGDD